MYKKIQCTKAIFGGFWSSFSTKKWEGVFIRGVIYYNKYGIKHGQCLWVIKGLPSNIKSMLFLQVAGMMVIGMDVYHDTVKKGSSVAGFVASMNRSVTRHYSRSIFQAPGEELVDKLVPCMRGKFSAADFFSFCNFDFHRN